MYNEGLYGGDVGLFVIVLLLEISLRMTSTGLFMLTIIT